MVTCVEMPGFMTTETDRDEMAGNSCMLLSATALHTAVGDLLEVLDMLKTTLMASFAKMREMEPGKVVGVSWITAIRTGRSMLKKTSRLSVHATTADN